MSQLREARDARVTASDRVRATQRTGRAMAKNVEALTLDHMKRGVDEEGKRIKIFTSALTNERAMQANYGHFQYDGQSIEVGRDQYRMHTSNLKDTVARHGHGLCVYTTGSRYEGQWDMDRRVGVGTFSYTCGDVYSGQWVKGKYHGTGTYRSASGGDNYEGQWSDDRVDGLGAYHYTESGERYEGEFVFGLRSGFGKYTYANGNFYLGQYKEGDRHGIGCFYFHADGDVEIGMYSEGRDAGEGARWNGSRTQACRLRDGVPIEFVQLNEAEAIAAKMGLPAPAFGPPQAAAMRPGTVVSATQGTRQAFSTGMPAAAPPFAPPPPQPPPPPPPPPQLQPTASAPSQTSTPSSSAVSGFGFGLPGLSFGSDGRIQW